MHLDAEVMPDGLQSHADRRLCMASLTFRLYPAATRRHDASWPWDDIHFGGNGSDLGCHLLYSALTWSMQLIQSWMMQAAVEAHRKNLAQQAQQRGERARIKATICQQLQRCMAGVHTAQMALFALGIPLRGAPPPSGVATPAQVCSSFGHCIAGVLLTRWVQLSPAGFVGL